MRDHLKGHFSGRYFLDKKEVSFAEAMTVGSMFYFKARRKKPHDAKLRKPGYCTKPEDYDFGVLYGPARRVFGG